MTSDLLSAVVAAARRSAWERERTLVVRDFDRAVGSREPKGQAFVDALRAPGAIRIIAECKRRSPSRGVLRQAYDPATIAAAYDAAGAAAISVLTEATFFDGSLDHLRAVRRVTERPVLRKDFIVTEFQVREARAAGADAILLIVAALDDGALVRLMTLAASLGLAALVEVHTAEELSRALSAGARIVGVNSRDLRTLRVHPERFEALAPLIPEGVVAVAESGLRSGADMRRLRAVRFEAFLVGERLMAASDPGAALRDLFGDAGAQGTSSGS